MGATKFTDIELIAALNVHNGNVTRAAKELNVTRAAVIKRKKLLPTGVIAPTIEEFRSQRADTFARFQQIILQYVTEKKLKGASLQQLGTLFGIMYDKERLERGQATEHIAHAHYEKLDENQMKALKEFSKTMVEDKMRRISYDE